VKIHRLLLPVLLVTLVVVSSAGAIAAEPTYEPTDGPAVWLKGAFGRVLGGDPGRPAAAPPAGKALDAFIRRAPLVLEVEMSPEDLLELTVVSRQSASGAAEERLSDGATEFEGPDVVGHSVITAAVTSVTHGRTEHAWLVDVPDREGDEEALFDITAPGVLVVSDAGAVAGSPGNGCYAYLCVDVGGPPPPDTLDPLQVGIGETLAVRTDDGSALAGWTGTLTPIGDGDGAEIKAVGALTDTVESMLTLLGLEPPHAGEWLLELRVDFDRERGWQWHAYRLVAG